MAGPGAGRVVVTTKQFVRDRATEGRTRQGLQNGVTGVRVVMAATLLTMLSTVTVAGQHRALDPPEPMGPGRRMALVVGNDAYEAESALRNAVNDARAMAAALEDVGFTVSKVENANRAELVRALAAFAGGLRSDDVALFYFAGHGVQVERVNYLIPTDYVGRTAAAVRLQALSAVDVEELLRGARVAMLVFDACRNNPYRGLRSGGTGLASMEARGTLIAYAAGAGQVAADAAPDTANGLFTAKLVEALEVPGLTATALFTRVRREVYQASNENQFPAVYDQLLSDFVFRPAEPSRGSDALPGESPAGAGTVGRGAGERLEVAFWDSIADSRDPADFEDYLGRFPDGTFAGLARRRMAALAVARPDSLRRPVEAPLAMDPTRPELPDPQRSLVGDVFRDCADCPQMMVVPSGTFMMGSRVVGQPAGTDSDERPRHRVTIGEPFAVGVYEVTFREWDACVGAGWCGGYRPSDRGWGRSARPVINVSWHDAQEYVRWLSAATGEQYRLLSEAEWEYVARALATSAYWWGDAADPDRAVCDGCGSHWDGQQTAPVGSFEANGFGLFDLAGNVWEWVDDCWHDTYEGAPTDGRAWSSTAGCDTDEGFGVLRGGSWADRPSNLRPARRIRNSRGNRGGIAGFRVARTLHAR